MDIISAIVGIAIVLFGFAGGGGSSSGGGGGGGGGYSGGSSYSSSSSGDSGDADPIAVLVVFAIIVIIVIISNRNDKKNLLRKSSVNNSTPEEKFIHEEAARIFTAYQNDWSNLNSANIATYTTPEYHEHVDLMIELYKDLHRVNKVSNLKIQYVYLPTHIDSNTPLPINLRIEFGFQGRDQVTDTKTNKDFYNQFASSVTETWNFVYDGKSLKLSGISQPTESAPHLVRSLADFANANHLFYSPDWGRTALPGRGLIFNKASMTVADINNHVIGKWDNLLIQLYTYSPTPSIPSSYYIVGQINVPKEYLGVIVKSKVYKAASKPDKSYDKFELEWPDFNKRYDVYASSRDALPAFELLNPKFMEFLYNKNPSYNLEVVDNVIYIFANISRITEKDYVDLLEVLKYAHKELKM